MLKSLPLKEKNLTIRQMCRGDLDELATWPSYPHPYQWANFDYGKMSDEDRDAAFDKKDTNPERINLIADHTTQPAVCYLTLVKIDWAQKKIGNMAYRVHPDWCDKGIGTSVMRSVVDWCFKHGMNSLMLDVVGWNSRAIRCYENAGFVKTGEFWRDDEGLTRIEIELRENEYLKPHVRYDSPVPRIRFFWMELNKETDHE